MKAVRSILFCLTYSTAAKQLYADGPISTNLKLVATADGKSFFADRSVSRSWLDAGKYCSDLGMKLDEITSKAQDDALKAAYGPDFERAYWTSGREAYEPPPLAWNSTGELVSGDYPEIRVPEVPQYLICLYYSSKPDNDSALSYGYCDGGRGTMCMT